MTNGSAILGLMALLLTASAADAPFLTSISTVTSGTAWLSMTIQLETVGELPAVDGEIGLRLKGGGRDERCREDEAVSHAIPSQVGGVGAKSYGAETVTIIGRSGA